MTYQMSAVSLEILVRPVRLTGGHSKDREEAHITFPTGDITGSLAPTSSSHQPRSMALIKITE